MQQVTRCLQALGRHPELFVVAFMVAIAGALVVPLPPALLDLLLVANLGISLTLLVSALHLRGPLALSTFPTLLLVATLFRLALNVSSTRLILGEGAAGKVIAAFGEFVVGGSYVVGAVVFVIVLIVQLMVVAKGAERVAEVGARFTLDALPGKQMAIDADLRAGACDQDEAARRRLELEKESQFYGSLDGAMKFVKGDAMAGLLITAINILGGLTVGMAVHGLPAGEAAATFTLLSIGDGLVSQLPALLSAVSAGLVVTRVGSGGRLGADVIEQLAAQPRAIVVSGVVLAFMGLVPGLPALPFLALGSLGIAGGLYKLTRGEEVIVGESVSLTEAGASRSLPPTSRAPCGANSSHEAEKLDTRAPIVLILDAHVPERVHEALVEEALPMVRREVASRLGLPLPPIPVIRCPRPGRGYEILLHEIPAFRGEVPDGDTVEAGYKVGSTDEEGEERAQPAQHGVVTPQAKVAREVASVATERAGEILSLETVQELLDLLEEQSPALAREAARRIPVPLLFEVLVRLLDEQASIRPLERIVEALVRRGEAGEGPASAASLSEHARRAIGRHLVHETAGRENLAVVILDPVLEDLLRRSRRETCDGPVLAMLPEQQSCLLEAMRRELHGGAVLLSPADLRRQLWTLTRGSIPDARVLAYQELPSDVRVQPVARLAIDGLDPLLLTSPV